MTPQHKFSILMAGILSCLILASAIGYWLKRTVTGDKAIKIVDNLIARTHAWWGMVFVLALAFYTGKTSTLILFGLLSFFALREFITLTPTKSADNNALSLCFFLLVPLQYYLISISWYGLFAILIPVYAFLLLPAISVLNQDIEQFLERTAKIQWGLMITVYCISHAPALLMLEITGYHGQSALMLFYLMLVAQMSDVFQYVFGMLFGKTKVAPVVSPNKTIEGLIGGGLCATLLGTSMWWITPFTPLQSAGMSFVIVAMGFLGGLVMSAIKRSMGTKDWGTLIKGHGGVLDRMDSICFAAPVFFHLTRYYFT